MKTFQKTYNAFKSVYQAFASKAARATGSRANIEGPIDPQVLQDVTDAITNRWQMSISYAGELGLKKLTSGTYSVTPCTYGLNKFTKNHILRAYFHGGGNDGFGFVTFRLDRMRSTTVYKTKTFDQAPPGFTTGADGSMSEIILQVKFPKNEQ